MLRISRRHTSEKGWLRAFALRGLAILLLVPCLAFSPGRDVSGRLPTLRTIHDVFRLSKAEAARAYPIELDAVVTYSDPEWGLLFIRDATGTSFIDVHGNGTRFPLGARVRINAVSIDGADGPAIGSAKITVLGAGVLPAPEQLSVAELDTGAGEAHRVVSEGILHPCEHNWNRVCFRLCDGQKIVWLMVPEQDSPAAQSLIGAIVRVKGMAGRHENDEHQRIGAQIFVNTLKDIQVESPPLPVSFSSSPTPIGSLSASDADQRFVRQTHLRGTVTWQSPGFFCIRDNSGTLFVGTRKTVAVHTGSTVDAIGFLSHGAFGLELSDSAVRPGRDPVERRRQRAACS